MISAAEETLVIGRIDGATITLEGILTGSNSVANLLVGFLSLMALAQRWGDGWALSLHFALLPYNLFLVAAVWRSPLSTPWTRGGALAWLGLTLLI